MKPAKSSLLLLYLSLTAALLSACSAQVRTSAMEAETPTPSVTAIPSLTTAPAAVVAVTASPESWWVEEQSRLDEQGAVSIVVTPLNLNNAYESIDFRVEMNTHSVDLSMDLIELATLSTDTGISVQASGWDGAAGGHHVSGTLSFPASVDGMSVLPGSRKLTLRIVDVDAPERLFAWER